MDLGLGSGYLFNVYHDSQGGCVEFIYFRLTLIVVNSLLVVSQVTLMKPKHYFQ
jgi:hypothetical protein